jgi:S-formylglutathione hydrolase FrmB
MRRSLAAIASAALVCAVGATPAAGARLLTWETPSRFVKPADIRLNKPPPGGPELAPALRVNVLLPDGFTRQRRYPVLFLLHGHGDRFDYWANPQRGDVRQVAKGFPGIIVMPEGARGWYTNWWSGGRLDPAWERYYLDELIPLVEQRLPIRSARRWHAIAGFSMGGEGAVFLASQRPGYFGSVAAFSGAISIQRPEWPVGFDTQGERHIDVFGDPTAQEFYWSGHNPTALVGNLRHTRVFVTVGDGVPDPSVPSEVSNYFGQVAEAELRQHAEDFVSAARAAGVDLTYHPRQGIHDWRYWRLHLADAIDWGFFRAVPRAAGSWGYETVAQTGDAWRLRFRFRPAPEGIERISLEDGRILRGFGFGRVTITTPSRCRFSIGMRNAWVTTLPRGWRTRPRTPSQRRHARAACAALEFGVAIPSRG